jgi:hypothetical protein
MARQYPVNIEIAAGVDFSKTFYMKNADLSATDITNYTFSARLAKHSGALNAVTSTSDSPVWKYIPFTVNITDAVNGVYEITLPAETTAKLEEGKYVYNITSQPSGGELSSNVSGLAFVSVAFGNTGSFGTLDPNYP